MSDEEEDSMSEGFSASEDEWKPSKMEKRGGESSDDDDSDFAEDEVVAGGVVGGSGAATASATNRKRVEPKSRTPGVKQTVAKKRKSIGQSLRSKLYNKYRPPPKTFPSSSGGGGSGATGSNSPSASTSRSAISSKKTASKNAKAPNDSSEPHDDNSSSDSSVEDYLVKPAELDLGSSFFNVSKGSAAASGTAAPIFDCSAGMTHLSDSGSEDNESSAAEDDANAKSVKAFDFRHLLEKANSLERAKETIAKRAAEASSSSTAANATATADAAMDVNSLLALGEKQCQPEDANAPLKLSKTKSTRIKRHTKTRPNSTILNATATGAAADTDDSDFEEVADEEAESGTDDADNTNRNCNSGSLEIHVELPTRQRTSRAEKKQQDIEMALRRRLNRDLKDRQLLLHKTSLLCCFGRSYFYNKLLNDPKLMQLALKLLPSKSAYPPERGTEIKYFQSLATWFKTAIKLGSPNLYPDKKTAALKKENVREELKQQLERKEARCKQDMIFLFAILVRGMGLQCRLIVNMQPLPLRPAQVDLLSLKMKRPDDGKDGESILDAKKPKIEDTKKLKIKNVPSKEKHEIKEEKEHVSTLPSPKENIKKNKESKENKASKEKSNEPKEKIQQAAKKINKPMNVEFTPVARRTRHGSTEKHSAKEKLNLDETISMTLKKSEAKLTSIEEKEKSEIFVEKKCNAPQKNKENIKATQDQCKSFEEKIKPPKQTKDIKLSGRPVVEVGSPVIPKIVIMHQANELSSQDILDTQNPRNTRSRSKSPKAHISPSFLKTKTYLENLNVSEPEAPPKQTKAKTTLGALSRNANNKVKISTQFLKQPQINTRVTRSRKLLDDTPSTSKEAQEQLSKFKNVPQLDGIDDSVPTPIFGFTPVALHTRHALAEKAKALRAPQNVEPIALRTRHACYERNIPKEAEIENVIEPTNSNPTKAKMLQNITNISTHRKNMDVEFTPIALRTRHAFKNNNHSNEVKEEIKIFSSLAEETVKENKCMDVEHPITLRKRYAELPQLDGADDSAPAAKKKRTQHKKLEKTTSRDGSRDEEPITIDSDEDFVPSPSKRPKQAPILPKAVQALRKERRVLSTDDENDGDSKRNATAADMWVEVWSDVEEQWICIDLFKGKIHSIESIRKSASSSFAYVFAFQNDLSIKDVTARYCPHWTTTMRKSRVDQSWLQGAISSYRGKRTKRDLCEDMELRRIHESKPMPTAISDYKDNPLYALERHLLKFQAIYPPDAPTLGFVRGEAVYSRDCVHLLHSREIWLKQARTVKLGEQPYKIVKARPKWDRLTQTVIKDQPLEIFGYWQTQDYEPPTAENGMVPRNAYGNVELFKACMLPKKTAHVKLNGLNRICKKLGIDCANAVIGFDFHQGACHPTYDGFVICEEFVDQVTAAWYQDQEDQERKDQEKYEARVYGNWKKLIRGLLIRERLKRKYNF